jgi:cell division protein FtsI/penicillin-binding protein 2
MIWFAPLLLWAPTLFDQSVVRVLTRDFPQAQYILVDVATGEVLGKRWSSVEQPIAMGSLVKPFTALAIDTAHSGPERCDPKQCWQPAGHGDIHLVRAVAESCNSYFLQKAASISPDRVTTVAARFDLPAPQDFEPGTLIGLGLEWRLPPERMAIAYAALVHQRDTRAILDGMRGSAEYGTAKVLAGAAMAKTGTAPCSHIQKAPGDGYVAMLYPVQNPRYVLLVQVHGVSGAEATRTAAKMLDVLRHGK